MYIKMDNWLYRGQYSTRTGRETAGTLCGLSYHGKLFEYLTPQLERLTHPDPEL